MFNSTKSKLKRVDQIFLDLESQINSFCSSKPYNLKNEFDIPNSEVHLVYVPEKNIPDVWPVIIGEIFHNLRSALDHVVYDLTLKQQNCELIGTEFPIFVNNDLFFEKKKDGSPTHRSGLFKIRGVSREVQLLIEKYQPYNLTETGKAHILSVIHEMNIIDKHRKLHLVRRLVESSKIVLISNAVNPDSLSIEMFANLDERAIIGRLKFLGKFENKNYLDGDLSIKVAFDISSFSLFKKNEDVLTVLKGVISGVKIIVDEIESKSHYA